MKYCPLCHLIQRFTLWSHIRKERKRIKLEKSYRLKLPKRIGVGSAGDYGWLPRTKL